MKLLVLGSGAGGGFPLWNCHCPLCSALRRGELDASARTQSSIAISQDGRPGEGWLLINASPDLPQQIRDTPALQPTGPGDAPIRAVLLLDSRLHHVAGLLSLRESGELEVYATPLVFEDLTTELPLLHVLEHYCRVRWRMLPIAGDARSATFEIPGFPALSFAAVAVPARAPRHARLRGESAASASRCRCVTCAAAAACSCRPHWPKWAKRSWRGCASRTASSSTAPSGTSTARSRQYLAR